MLGGLVSPESLAVNSMDMSVLEKLKWLQQQQQHHNHMAQNNNSHDLSPLLQLHGSSGRDLTRFETSQGINDLPSFGHFPMAGGEFEANYNMGFVPPHDVMDGCISRTNSCQMEAEDATKALMNLKEEEGEGVPLSKRKAEFDVGEESGDKKIKRELEAESSTKGKSKDTEMSSDTSKENSKASEIQKTDYIHVRARRGQATDRHSLAERARREKISKKMKCLQDLVPGCNKITGKAGMLDEIINYVQSLQRQVEFLSMKLAVLNPTQEFDTDDLVAKQFPAYVANFPAAATKPPEMAGLGCLQISPLQQEGALDFPVMNQNQTTVRHNTMSPESKVQPSSTWDNHSQTLYNVTDLGF